MPELLSKSEQGWMEYARNVERLFDGLSEGYQRIDAECAAAHRRGKRWKRAFLMASGIAGLLAMALIVVLAWRFVG